MLSLDLVRFRAPAHVKFNSTFEKNSFQTPPALPYEIKTPDRSTIPG